MNITKMAADAAEADEAMECVRRYVVEAGSNKTQTAYFYAGYSGIPENLTLNIIMWLIMFGVFLVVRWIRIFREKRDVTEGGRNMAGLYVHVHDFLGWIPELFRKGDEDIQARCGWDAVIYLRFQRYLMLLTGGAAVLSLCVALPVNFSDDLVSDFGKTTIANVDGNSDLIWIHVVLAAVYLVATILLMKRFTARYVKTRAPKEVSRTLLVAHVPTKNVTNDDIYQYFSERFEDAKIETINFAYRVKEVNAIEEKRKYAGQMRAEAIVMDTDTAVRDKMKPYPCACFCCCCPKCQRVVTAEWCVQQGETLREEYDVNVTKALKDPLDIVFINFYTENMAVRVYNAFNKVWHMRCVCKARCCPQTELDGRNWIVYYSPRYDDIYWHNLGASDVWWWLKAAVLNLGLLFFLFIFTTPSVFMNLLDEWRYKDAIHGLNSPLLVNVIPVLLLCVFSSLLPLLVYFSELLIGHWKRTIEEKLIMQKTYALLLLMILILPSLGLTSAKALLMWVADKKGTIDTFRWKCVFLPDNGAFFVNYVVSAAFMGTALQLLRVGDLLVFAVRLLLARSAAERQLVRKLEGSPFPYGQQYAWVGVVSGVVISYSVTCPLIVPFGLAYLVMKHLVDRHNLYYVTKPVRLGGQVHARAVTFIKTAVILLQVWMIVFTAIRSDKLPPTSAFSLAVLILALIYLTGNAVYAWIKHQIARMKLVLTNEDQQLSNLNDRTSGTSAGDRYNYIPPVLLAGSLNPASIVSTYPIGGSSVA